MPKASSLAAEIKIAFGVESELVAGGGGIFDVHVDKELIYSKHETGRFPNDGEVIGLLRELNTSS